MRNPTLMVPELQASIGLSTADLMRIAPRGAASFRKLQRALAATGLRPTIDRVGRAALLPLQDLEQAEQALREWQVEVDGRVRKRVEAREDARRRLSNARTTLDHLQIAGAARAELKDFTGLDRLDEHQVIAVAALTHPDIHSLCLFDEQGLGKTVQVLFAYHRLRQQGDTELLFVFAPKNMVLEWEREAERFLGPSYDIRTVTGTEREKRDALNQRADIYVTNFETADRLSVRIRQLFRSKRGKVLLVVDESFYVKNPGARRTRALRALRGHVERCVVLCGTPAPNAPHDLVEQFNIADDGTTFADVRIPEDREDARPVVRAVIEERGVYLRRLKQEVLPDLPDKTFSRVLIPMAPQQRRVYVSGLLDLIHDLKETDDITFRKNLSSFMARRTALLQICSNPSSVVDGYEELPAKLAAMDSILATLIERQHEKVVIWSFFTRSLDEIVRRYEKYRPVRVDGTVTDTRLRRAAIQRFQEDDETKLFVGNPAAAGAGITLHRARLAIYESMSNQAAHYLQSLDRIHRRGQHRPVEYIVLLCDESIEVQEYERLCQKEAAAQDLLGDVVTPPVTRDAMLSEILQTASLLGSPGPGDHIAGTTA